MTWKTTSELLSSVRQATDRLISGETAVDQSHAEARLLGTAGKIMAIRLEHAKLTGRLSQGSDVLPDFKLDD